MKEVFSTRDMRMVQEKDVSTGTGSIRKIVLKVLYPVSESGII